MKKIAFFVEGQTEQIFVNRLVKEILGYDRISVISKRSVGGTKIPKQEIVRSATFSRKPLYQVLINDCGSDNRVKSEILENLENLRESGYTSIIGIRDLYPLPISDLERLEKGLKFLPANIRKYKNPFDILVVVQEIETWFLGETTHFRKVDKRLTSSFIKQRLGFDPYAVNAMQRRHPSRDLNDIYQLVGKSYTKRNWQVKRLVDRLNFDFIFRHMQYDIPVLNQLVQVIEDFKEN